MFERMRFARYALRFERAFKTDDWTAVRECFDPDATYTAVGGGEYDGLVRGRDAIMTFFQKMLNELDRKADKRIPGLAGFPRVKGGELVLPWKARYVLGSDSAILNGVSRCRFKDGKIIELSDTMVPEETSAALAMLTRSGRSATPS